MATFDEDVAWAEKTGGGITEKSIQILKNAKAQADKGNSEAKRDYGQMVAEYKKQVRDEKNYFSAAILKALGESYEPPAAYP